MRKLTFLSLVIMSSALVLSACTAPNPSGDPNNPAAVESDQTPEEDLQLGNNAAGQAQPQLNQQLTNPGETSMNPNDPATSQMVSEPNAPITAETAVIKTSKGDITVKLYPDQAPNTVANFAQKAVSDYYQGLTFHRVEDWVIQGGDPRGNGTGGGQMATELNEVPFAKGSLGVARGGDIRISNDSQFFICTTDCSWLTGQYTNFGEVIDGMDVAESIEVGDKITGISVLDSE